MATRYIFVHCDRDGKGSDVTVVEVEGDDLSGSTVRKLVGALARKLGMLADHVSIYVKGSTDPLDSTQCLSDLMTGASRELHVDFTVMTYSQPFLVKDPEAINEKEPVLEFPCGIHSTSEVCTYHTKLLHANCSSLGFVGQVRCVLDAIDVTRIEVEPRRDANVGSAVLLYPCVVTRQSSSCAKPSGSSAKSSTNVSSKTRSATATASTTTSASGRKRKNWTVTLSDLGVTEASNPSEYSDFCSYVLWRKSDNCATKFDLPHLIEVHPPCPNGQHAHSYRTRMHWMYCEADQVLTTVVDSSTIQRRELNWTWIDACVLVSCGLSVCLEIVNGTKDDHRPLWGRRAGDKISFQRKEIAEDGKSTVFK